MTVPKPPPRHAHLFGMEQGDGARQAQRALLYALEYLSGPATDFQGDAAGRIWRERASDTSARLAFTSNLGDGHIDLTLADDGWVRAELFVNDVLKLRAWVEDPYEEKEFWPDGATGVGDAPGRISKRGRWLNIDCANFPGVPANPHGFWQVEDALD